LENSSARLSSPLERGLKIVGLILPSTINDESKGEPPMGQHFKPWDVDQMFLLPPVPEWRRNRAVPVVDKILSCI
jgi:hypothetical protein